MRFAIVIGCAIALIACEQATEQQPAHPVADLVLTNANVGRQIVVVANLGAFYAAMNRSGGFTEEICEVRPRFPDSSRDTGITPVLVDR